MIDFIQTEEGRAINTGTGWNYEYTLTDHLGNNRVTFDMINGKTGEDDYYPFGLDIQGAFVTNPKNLYTYNKKELQQEFGQYDYGARFYDPVIARFTTIDSYAEKSRRWSPYNYGEDNSIRNIDIDGDSTIVVNGKKFVPGGAHVAGGDGSKPNSVETKEAKSTDNSSNPVVTILKSLGAFMDKLDNSLKGNSTNETPGGLVETMDNGTGEPGGKAKNISSKDHIDLTNVFAPLGVLTPDKYKSTDLLNYATDVVTGTANLVKSLTDNNNTEPKSPSVAVGIIGDKHGDTVFSKGANKMPEGETSGTVLFRKADGTLSKNPDNN